MSFLRKRLDLDEYVDYITDLRLENKKYFYNGLNSDNIEIPREVFKAD